MVEDMRRKGKKILTLSSASCSSIVFGIAGLSDEVLAQLSPAAAAASKLLKPHMGLTEIYSEVYNRPLIINFANFTNFAFTDMFQLVTYKEKFFECESQKRNVEIQLTEVLRYVEGKTAGNY